jgi:short-subunit dehydrogenase
MKQLQNKVIVVTGASAGIGRSIAAHLVQHGANVLATARRAERLEQLAQEVRGEKGVFVYLAGDIQSEAFCHALIAEAVERFGRIDVLINNAGLGHSSKLSEISAEHLQTIFDTNIRGLLFTCQAAIPQMKTQGVGQIINVSSIVGQRPLINSGMYCASKTAVNFLSRSLRMELRRHNITVSLLYPGLTATEFHVSTLGGRPPRRIGGISPQRVANVTLKAIQRRREEIYVTWYDWLFAHANRLLPRTLDHVFRMLNKW